MFSDISSKFTKSMQSLGLGSPSEKSKKLEEKLAQMSEEDQECYEEWGLTFAEEDELIEQLRQEVEMDVKLKEYWDNEMLRRFLRARKHNIVKAKAMIIDTVKWRDDMNVDTLLETFDFHEREEFHKHYPEGFFWTDREGRPVYVQRPGDIDCTALWKFTTLERSILYHITQQERYVNTIAPTAVRKGGRKCFQSTVIIDMDGVGVSTLTGEVRTIMGKVMSIDQDHYPELMYKALIINAPTSFRVIWSLVKHLLDSRTQEKIEVLPSDYKPHLLKHIAPENLMTCYGGTNEGLLIDCPGPWSVKEDTAQPVSDTEEKNIEDESALPHSEELTLKSDSLDTFYSAGEDQITTSS